MESLTNFIGNLHPILVHLPIGFLLIGIILLWWDLVRRKEEFTALTSPIFFMGALAATMACASGYMRSLSNEYDMALVNGHRNAGILLAVLSAAFWWLTRKGRSTKISSGLSVAMAGLLIWTGHQGGSLTHGEGFLFSNTTAPAAKIKPIANVKEAIVYADIIQPILNAKCTGCHGPEKQKGKLRLDGKEHIMNGGKNGKVVVGRDLDKSEMLNRILLPPDDEDHMPPKEKGQLSKHQISLIRWWIIKGADFEKKVIELEPDQTIQPALASLGTVAKDVDVDPELPPVKAGDTSIISALRRSGVIIVPIAQGSNYLSANLINCPRISDTVLRGLNGLSEQLVWLKAEGSLVNDEIIKQIVACRKLRRLSLANATITAASLRPLQQLSSLEYLNLFGTSIQDKYKLPGSVSR